MIKPEAVYRLDSSFVVRHVGSKCLLVQAMRKIESQEAKVYVIGGTGKDILDILDGTKTMQDICDQMLAEYDVEEKQLWQCSSEFIEKLIEIGAIKTDTSESSSS
jgi:hypothetical protein